MRIHKSLIWAAFVAFCSLFVLAGCDDTPRQQHTQVVQVAAIQTAPSCGRYYDNFEQGYVTQCFDPGNRQCFTLYKPSGRQAYYCNGIKQWQTARQSNWNGAWGFAAGMALSEVIRPKYINRTTKPARVRSSTYKRPVYKKSNANKALNAASKQTTTPKGKNVTKPNKSNANAALAAAAKQRNTANTKVTPMTKKPKVDLTKKPKVDLTKKTTKPKVVLAKKPTKKLKVVVKKKKKKSKK